ncbi:MAG: protein adenylyltransferase SelO, partial [Thalassobaculaceae bacterium]
QSDLPGATPLAMAYAGHQFGNWVPQLGDGRAILLGEVVDPQGRRRDIQLKGAGPTPFSRMGDGRAAIGPVLREFIVSEAMAALGVPTTRALAAVATGEEVFRERPLPGAVLTRVASSHIRVGTFQFFAARQDLDALGRLADHVIARHDPAAADSDTPYRALLDGVVARQAALLAKWMAVGFIHGVMNTDNMSIAGETIDYGPCAFMDHFHPETVFSSIDQGGRYAYINQPGIAQWNLACLAQALVPLLDGDQDRAVATAKEALDRFPALFESAYLEAMAAKLGIPDAAADDLVLVGDWLRLLTDHQADFTTAFRRLGQVSVTADDSEPLSALFGDGDDLRVWLARWRARLAGTEDATRQAAMDAVNPCYIPRNHLVEAALGAAEAGDLTPFEDLLAVLRQPYTEQPGRARHAAPPAAEEVVRQTFCGT